MVVIMRTTAGFAISAARTAGLAMLPPGVLSAYAVYAGKLLNKKAATIPSIVNTSRIQ